MDAVAKKWVDRSAYLGSLKDEARADGGTSSPGATGVTSMNNFMNPNTKTENEESKASKKSFFSGFFGGNKRWQENENAPVIYDWQRNDDGSITGYVRGASDFPDGTRITTSAVKREAKSGSAVWTSSGNQYKLE